MCAGAGFRRAAAAFAARARSAARPGVRAPARARAAPVPAPRAPPGGAPPPPAGRHLGLHGREEPLPLEEQRTDLPSLGVAPEDGLASCCSSTHWCGGRRRRSGFAPASPSPRGVIGCRDRPGRVDAVDAPRRASCCRTGSRASSDRPRSRRGRRAAAAHGRRDAFTLALGDTQRLPLERAAGVRRARAGGGRRSRPRRSPRSAGRAVDLREHHLASACFSASAPSAWRPRGRPRDRLPGRSSGTPLSPSSTAMEGSFGPGREQSSHGN